VLLRVTGLTPLVIEERSWPNAGHQARLEAGARHERTLEAVVWMPWLGAARARRHAPLAQEPCAYGQSRGVMPFSCAYLAAAASTKGRTSA
jgi:hypothetical protein